MEPLGKDIEIFESGRGYKIACLAGCVPDFLPGCVCPDVFCERFTDAVKVQHLMCKVLACLVAVSARVLRFSANPKS